MAGNFLAGAGGPRAYSRRQAMGAFLRRLLQYVRPYRARLVLGIVSGILFGLTNALLMIVVRVVVDLIFPTPGAPTALDQIEKLPSFLRGLVERLEPLLPRMDSPTTMAGIILVVSSIPLVMFVRSVLSYLNFYLLNWVAIRAIMDLRTKLFAHLQNLSLSFFHESRTGDLISRLANDTGALHKTISATFPTMIREPITLVSLLAVLFWQQPQLTLVSLAVIPVCVFPLIIYGRKVRKSSQAIQDNFAELTNQMQEAFTGHRIVKAYNLEQTVIERFEKTTKKYNSHFMRIVRSMEIPGNLIEFMSAVGVSLVLIYVAGTKTTSGEFFQFILCVFAMYQPIKGLSRLYGQLEQARASSERVFELLDTRPTVVEPAASRPLRADGAQIHFDHVDFSYGDKLVLEDVDLIIERGQLAALVGRSGSGKTTLTNLLLRFYDPQRGVVRIGETDIREVSLKDLRNQIAVVTQETILFNETIRANIALGRPGATQAEIESAAKHAYAHDFILEKPAGYDTVVGEQGVSLSGGQRQRLAIARAILKNAPILILDEAMSALDSESERAVQAALEELMKERTTICIAHRLSTVQNADVIVVMDQGRIVERGRHSELVPRNGVYRKLYELQFQA